MLLNIISDLLSSGWVTIFIAIVFVTIVVIMFRTISKLRKTEEERLKLATGVIDTDEFMKEEVAKRDKKIAMYKEIIDNQKSHVKNLQRELEEQLKTDNTDLEQENEALKAALEKARRNESLLQSKVAGFEQANDLQREPLSHVADAYIYEGKLYYKAQGSSRKWKAAQEHGTKIYLLIQKSHADEIN
jgi:cbb3-type cytochrome oxidase subunit 3